MKITVTKGNIVVNYEEPQKDMDYPRIISDEHYHKRVLDSIKLICEQVIELSK